MEKAPSEMQASIEAHLITGPRSTGGGSCPTLLRLGFSLDRAAASSFRRFYEFRAVCLSGVVFRSLKMAPRNHREVRQRKLREPWLCGDDRHCEGDGRPL